MTHTGWIHFVSCVARPIILLTTLTTTMTTNGKAQTGQLMRVKLGVLPSVSVAGMDPELHRALGEERPRLITLIRDQAREADTIMVAPGFSILAYENISVLLSVTLASQTYQSKSDSSAVRVACGYLNDGTTYFRRATIANRTPIQFRLKNNNLLKRSMQFPNPLFVAYVFFLVDQRKAEIGNERSPLIMTVTVEFL